MTCEVEENCKCAPAEAKMLCDCKDLNLTAQILDPEHQLHILRPNLEFRTSNDQHADLIESRGAPLEGATAENFHRRKLRNTTVGSTDPATDSLLRTELST
ncbi:hypothetical protein NECAME_11783 [Necator americanus]|uniref:Phlebovirus glycoprotein G2 fusion domain-containing protein n=1 Tax=Necator americanus TaxID=51031 RepID=W2T5Q1_NECAM|nr:hypothetical protein NECAME_11783 [Necator americanus]ETN76277.1 hypothetical protein NECAME_11783 [Necator americanus]